MLKSQDGKSRARALVWPSVLWILF